MKPNVHTTIKTLLSEKLHKLEKYFEADVFCYYGALVDGLESQILSIVEELANDENKKDLDLAELRGYEQAKELTIDLLKKWLVKFKFKNWNTHNTHPQKVGQPVTDVEKVARAEEIAGQLSDNSFWKSHSRPINVERLRELRLKVEDFSNNGKLKLLVRDYYDLLSDYVTSNNLPIFVNTRNFI